MSNLTQKTDQDVLNELLLGMSVVLNSGYLEELEQLSKAYQRIKSVQTVSVNDLQQFLKPIQGATQ